MRRGRKPKPTALKRLAGNPGKRPLNEDEPQVKSNKRPTCPRHLDKEARKEWRRLAKQLAEAGILTEIDRAVLVAYCRAWSLYVEADRKVQEFGTMLISKRTEVTSTNRKTGEVTTTVSGGVPYQSPHVNQMTAAMKDVVRFAVELGMTPSARSRVTAVPVESGEKEGKSRFFKMRVVG